MICPSFPTWKPLPFIVQGRPLLQGTKRRKVRYRERESESPQPRRSGSSILSVGATNLVSRRPRGTTVQVLRCGMAVSSHPYASCFVGRGRACADKYGTTVMPRPGATRCHSVVTEACPPDRDGIVPHPLARTGRWYSTPCCHSRGGYNPPWRGCLVVYDRLTLRLILILRTYLLARKSGLASRPACRSGRRARVRRSPVGVLGQRLGTNPAPNHSHSRGYGPRSSRQSCQSGLWAETT
jgi:hypothetical protein